MSNLPKPPDPTPPLAQLRERFHHSARRGFLAGSPYACLLADDFADTLLCSRILAAVSGQFLDTEIRAMWDHVDRKSVV